MGAIENLPDFIAKKAERLKEAHAEAEKVRRVLADARHRHYSTVVKDGK